ncbi:MAG: hypothetical protein KatS3mg043_1505 [Rhodothermaceae bacterium]|nr:MAG: hypothetical protein KatS3mg043_1505 [Rhodothermaceae bacterium]
MRRFLLVCCLGLLGAPALAQLPDSVSAHTQVSLLTILPGEALYAAFGHSALRVHDPATGFDAVFNYGTFDFRDPLFLPKFAYGRLDYFLSVSPLAATLRGSRLEGRPVIEQVLNLSQEQVAALYRFLRINARPENRTYRYDFLFDNCSTRLRDVLATTLGPALRFAPQPDPGLSFRRLLDPYLADRPWIDLGIDLLLGASTDRTATPHEVMFLPDYLMTAFDHATVVQGETARPLVARRDTLLVVPDYTPPAKAPAWPLWSFAALFAAGLAGTFRSARRPAPEGTAGRWDVLLFAATGLVGCFMLFMWLGTEHHVTRWNANLLWALPVHLPVAVLLWRGHFRGLRGYFIAAAAVTGVALAGALLDRPQDFHPATLPLILLLLLRCVWWSFRLRPAPRATASPH